MHLERRRLCCSPGSGEAGGGSAHFTSLAFVMAWKRTISSSEQYQVANNIKVVPIVLCYHLLQGQNG